MGWDHRTGGTHCGDAAPQLHYERDLGVPIDVIDPRNYLLPKNPVPLPPEDEALLNWREGEGDGPGSGACVSYRIVSYRIVSRTW